MSAYSASWVKSTRKAENRELLANLVTTVMKVKPRVVSVFSRTE
jgi:hypothetical protein